MAEVQPRRQVTVTATLKFVYDLDEGLVDSPEAALEDVKEMIATGDIPVNQFDFAITADLDDDPQ